MSGLAPQDLEERGDPSAPSELRLEGPLTHQSQLQPVERRRQAPGGLDHLDDSLVGAPVGPKHADEHHRGCGGQPTGSGTEALGVDSRMHDRAAIGRTAQGDGVSGGAAGEAHEAVGRGDGALGVATPRRQPVEGVVGQRFEDGHGMGNAHAPGQCRRLSAPEREELEGGDHVDRAGIEHREAPEPRRSSGPTLSTTEQGQPPGGQHDLTVGLLHGAVGDHDELGVGHGPEEVELVGDPRRRQAEEHPHHRPGTTLDRPDGAGPSVRSSSSRQFQVATSRSTGTLTIQRWDG